MRVTGKKVERVEVQVDVSDFLTELKSRLDVCMGLPPNSYLNKQGLLCWNHNAEIIREATVEEIDYIRGWEIIKKTAEVAKSKKLV